MFRVLQVPAHEQGSLAMESESSPPVSPTSALASALPRGGACLPCRRRKMRCDGGKPACGQCINKGRAEDCEYTSEMQGLTRTQMLEENISLLESRIRELENPAATTPSVRLHAPRIVTTVASGSSVMLSSPVSTAPVAGPSSAGAHPSSPVQQTQPGAMAQGPQPSVQETYIMVNAFTPHASQIGFFLNIPRFMQHVYASPGSRELFMESLIATVCLWGSRLSRNPALGAFEESLLSWAVHLVSGSLFLANSETRGHAIIGVIQAEVLLSNYFFSLGRFLEGRYHCSAATSLAISCRLNALGNRQDPHTQGGLAMDLVRAPDLGLASIDSGDAVQAGEQVNAFWTVFILDKTWAIAMGVSSSITNQIAGGIPISTPWPLSMEAYEQGERPRSDDNNTLPVYGVLTVPSTADDLARSTPLTLRARACIMFSRASLLASQYQNGMPNADNFWHEFNRLDNLINAFITSFPLVTIISRGDNCERLVANTIARVAAIQLHVRFVGEQARSRQRCLIAANAIVTSIQDIRSNDLGFMDPIMAIFLSSAGQVIISEMKAASMGPTFVTGAEQVTAHADSLNQILAVMADFGSVCPLMASQATQIEEARGEAF